MINTRSCTAFLVLSTLVLFVAAAANRGPSGIFGAEDVKLLEQSLKLPYDNIKDNHYAVNALTRVGAQISKKDEVCASAKTALDNARDVETIYHAVRVATELKCAGATANKAATDALQTAIADSESLSELFFATLAVLDLKSNSQISFNNDDFAQVVTKVTDLKEDDGTFKSNPDSDEGSLFNAGLATYLLSKLYDQVGKDEKTSIEEVGGDAEGIVEMASEEAAELFFEDVDQSISNLHTTGAVVRGVVSLSNALKKSLDIAPESLSAFGEYFVQRKVATSPADAYYLTNGLKAVSAAVRIGAPLVITLQRGVVSSAAKGSDANALIRVSDVFGKAVTGVTVTVVKAHAAGQAAQPLLTNQGLTASSDEASSFPLNLIAAKAEQGSYIVEVRATSGASDSKVAPTERIFSVKVTGAITITDFEVSVAGTRDVLGDVAKQTVEYGKKLDKVVSVAPGQFVRVSFRVRAQGSGKAVSVQQAVVRLSNAAGGEAYFVAQPNDQKLYIADISIEDAGRKQLRSESGTYDVEVIVGDGSVQNPIKWVAASLSINFVTPAVQREALAALPNIEHQFRVPEKRPPSAVSQVFTIATLAPLALFLIGLLVLGANITRLGRLGADSLSALLFVGSIGGLLGVIAVYWLTLTMIQALGYLALVSIPATFFGQRTLRALARTRKSARAQQ